MLPANSITTASSYVSRVRLCNILKAESRPVSNEALLALIKKVEEEQSQGMVLFSSEKASMKPLNEPLKNLSTKIKISEDLLEKMYESWKSTSNSEYDDDLFIKWVEDERRAFLVLTCDLLRLSGDKTNPLSAQISQVVERFVGKKLHRTLLKDIENYITKDDFPLRFETLYSLLSLLFLFLYEKMRKEPAYSKEAIVTVGKIFKLSYKTEDKGIVDAIFDLATVICVEIFDFESLFEGYKVLSEKELVINSWGFNDSIDASNSVQALAFATWALSAELDVGSLASRAYQAGVFYRIQAIITNPTLFSESVDALSYKTIMNDFMMTFLSTFDLHAIGDLDLVIDCLCNLLDEPKLSEGFWTNEAFEVAARNLLDTLSNSFPLRCRHILRLLESVCCSTVSSQKVLKYFGKLEVLCVNRSPDRGLVLETLKDGAFNLVVSRNMEVFCDGVGFYLLAGTKGISFEEEPMASEVPVVRWQIEYSGWYYLIRSLAADSNNVVLILNLVRKQIKYLGKHFLEHMENSSPQFSLVKGPALDLTVSQLLVRMRDSPQVVYCALNLLNELELSPESIREMKSWLNLLCGIFYIDDEDVVLPNVFCDCLRLFSCLVLQLPLNASEKEQMRMFVNGHLMAFLPKVKFEQRGLEAYCSAIFYFCCASEEQDKAMIVFAKNCIQQRISIEAAIKYIILQKDVVAELVDWEIVEKALGTCEEEEFVNVCIAKKHLPLTPKALDLLTALVLSKPVLLQSIVENWPEMALTIFSTEDFNKKLLQLMTNLNLKVVSSLLCHIWKNPQMYYSVILKIRESVEFWKCLEEHVAKGEASNETKANLVSVYTNDLLLFKKQAAYQDLLKALVQVGEDVLGELMERPFLGTALVEFMAALCTQSTGMENVLVSAACRYILSHIDGMSEGALVILNKLNGQVPWEALTKVFIERLSHETVYFAEIFFKLLLERKASVNKSLLISCLSLCCHSNARKALQSLLMILVTEEDDVQIIHVIQRDQVLPLLMREVTTDAVHCLTVCSSKNRRFRELVIRSGFIYNLPSESDVQELFSALAEDYCEEVMGVLGMVGFSGFDIRMCRLCQRLLENASPSSPVTHAFVNKLIPYLFLQLRLLSLKDSSKKDSVNDYLQLLKVINNLLPSEMLKEGIERMREPPVRYEDILTRLKLEYPNSIPLV